MREPIQAGTIGPLASRALQRGQGRVLAAFRSTAWVQLQAGPVCLTLASVPPGPLNIATELDQGDWRSTGLRSEQKVLATPSGLTFEHFSVETQGARHWDPDHFARPHLAKGLAALATARRKDLVPRDLQDAAGTWCRNATRDLEWACQLIGRGPGLTPSGDDYLGGVLIALHALGREPQAKALWAAVQGPAKIQTNPISYALLAAASEGLGSAALHAALNGIGLGHPMQTYVAGIDALGHSSGWDALAGAVTVFEAEQALA